MLHDQFLHRYLINTGWFRDIGTALFYYRPNQINMIKFLLTKFINQTKPTLLCTSKFYKN